MIQPWLFLASGDEDGQLAPGLMTARPFGLPQASEGGAAAYNAFHPGGEPLRCFPLGSAPLDSFGILRREASGSYTGRRSHVRHSTFPFDLNEPRPRSRLEISQRKGTETEDISSHGTRDTWAAAAVEGRKGLGIPPSIRSRLTEASVKRIRPASFHNPEDRPVGMSYREVRHAWYWSSRS